MIQFKLVLRYICDRGSGRLHRDLWVFIGSLDFNEKTGIHIEKGKSFRHGWIFFYKRHNDLDPSVFQLRSIPNVITFIFFSVPGAESLSLIPTLTLSK